MCRSPATNQAVRVPANTVAATTANPATTNAIPALRWGRGKTSPGLEPRINPGRMRRPGVHRSNVNSDKEKSMGFILWLIIGGVVGWLASLIMRRDASQGIILNVVVGIVGAMLGGWLVGPIVGAPSIN